MKPPKNVDTSSRIFIVGLRNFEIVYLPSSDQIVSLVGPGKALIEEKGRSPGASPFRDQRRRDQKN